MRPFTSLPKAISNGLQVLRPMFRHRHHLLIPRRGDGLVMAFARPWCFANGHTLKDLMTHLPTKRYRRCWVPREEPGRRRTYWT
jgi:hypothetical protein